MAIIYTDGGSRGNPGPAAAGYWITEYGKILHWKGVFLGIKTCNEAEYDAVEFALNGAINLGLEYIDLRSDSKLVVEQLNGNWKISNPVRVGFIKDLLHCFKKITFTHIPREQNQVADFICNITLNEQEGK